MATTPTQAERVDQCERELRLLGETDADYVGGLPHGPGDLPPGAVVHVSPQYTEDAPADIPTWWPREREAAYVTPESADLIRRAVAVGYPIDPRVRLLTESPP